MIKTTTIFIVLILSLAFNLSSSVLKFQDTVYIDPAYYNKKFEGIGTHELFSIELSKDQTVEIISIVDELQYSIENPSDKSIVNCVPNYYPNKNGNLMLEGGSKFYFEAFCFFRNPKSQEYSTELFINYINDNEFFTDTINVIAKRVDKDIYTRNQNVTINTCDFNQVSQNNFKITSTLLNGSNSNITINDITISSNLNYEIKGFYNGVNENQPILNENLNFPYILYLEYFSLVLEIEDKLANTDFVYVDYNTNMGVFTDTLGIISTSLNGITAKTWYQTLTTLDYESVTSLKNAVKICSEEGYRVKSLILEGEIEESEIELTEYYEVGDIINGDFIELSQYTITPKKIPVQRSGKFVYELENVANGTVLEVDFPFTLEVDFSASVYDNLPEEYSVYPNPTSSLVSVKGSDEIIRLELVDLLGNTVISGNGTKTLDVEYVAAGVYLLKIVERNSIKLEKIIVE